MARPRAVAYFPTMIAKSKFQAPVRNGRAIQMPNIWVTCNRVLPTAKLSPLKFTLIGLSALFAYISSSQTVSAESSFKSYAPVDVYGRGLAVTIENEAKAQVQRFAKSGIFLGLTGDLKPSAKVSYRAGDLRPVSINGQTEPGAEFSFEVLVRVKLDALGGPFTTKIAAVETRQNVIVKVNPVQQGTQFGFTGVAEITSATATKERKAKQGEADDLREKVRAMLTENLNKALHFVPLP